MTLYCRLYELASTHSHRRNHALVHGAHGDGGGEGICQRQRRGSGLARLAPAVPTLHTVLILRLFYGCSCMFTCPAIGLKNVDGVSIDALECPEVGWVSRVPER